MLRSSSSSRRALFALLAASVLTRASGFVLSPRNGRATELAAASQPDDRATSVCDVPSIDVESLVGPGGASRIMSSMVTAADGTVLRIDDAVEDKTRPNVIVFLRHMG